MRDGRVQPWAFVLALAPSALACTSETLDLDPTGAPQDAGVEADAGVASRDAGASPSRDAGVRERSDDYWSLEPVAATLWSPGPFYDLGTAYVRVAILPETVCDYGGPVDLEPTPGGFLLTAHVWRHHIAAPGQPPCDFINNLVQRDVPVPIGVAAEVDVTDAVSGVTARVIVESTPAVDCNAQSQQCLAHCECAESLECVPGVGREAGRCAQACNPIVTGCCGDHDVEADLECPPSMGCRAAGDGSASGWCEPLDRDGCDPDACPPGMGCPDPAVASRCAWTVQLNSSVRHACVGSADCDEGLVCVDRGDRRACEIPCFSSRMGCPPMHACSGPAGWVCEWLGE